jgi:hypothetical protein
LHSREDVLVCACRGARVLSATVEVIAVLVNSEAIARACVVFELEQVRDGQYQLLAVPKYPVLLTFCFGR